MPSEGRTQFLTFASVVAVIDSVIGGSTVAVALSVALDAPLGVTASTGGAMGVLSLVLLLRHADHLLKRRAGSTESIFPSP